MCWSWTTFLKVFCVEQKKDLKCVSYYEDQLQIRMWTDLPDAPLLAIFELLPPFAVLQCSLVCRRFALLARDELLWKRLFHRHLLGKRDKRKMALRPGSEGWLSEYRRLCDTSPRVCVHDLANAHTDEVLHVSFSHDGKELLSCSKDCFLKVWNVCDNKLVLCYEKDMHFFQWLHTWASQFNASDTKVLVSGVVDEVSGEIAIFSTGESEGRRGDYTFVCRVVNDPYDVLGSWCSEEHFLSGTLSNNLEGELEASVWICKAIMTMVGDDTDGEEGQQQQHQQQQPVQQQQHPPPVSVDAYDTMLFRFSNDTGTSYLRYLSVHNLPELQSQCTWPPMSAYTRLDLQEQPPDWLEFVNNNSLTAIFLSGSRCYIPHEMGLLRLERATRELLRLSHPEKVLEFDGHIIGFALEKEKRMMYVNVRAWPKNALPSLDQPPPIADRIEVHEVDLHTLNRTGKVFVGHRGYTPTERAFYIYVDSSQDFLSSGSEDCQGFVWERHYAIEVAKLRHNACVNCVAVCPSDQQLCVSASDDHSMKLWTSSRRFRELQKEDLQ